MSFTMIFALSCGDDDEPTPIIIEVKELFLTVDENPPNGQVLGSVEVTSNAQHLTFSLSDQSSPGAMQIDSQTGELTVLDNTKFNYETNTSITGKVTVSAESTSKSALVTVRINDLGDAVITVSDFQTSIKENPAMEEVIGKISASSDQEGITFTMASQSVPGALDVNATTGEIIVSDPTKFDFEVGYDENSLFGTVNVAKGSIVKEVNLKVTLIDVGTPVFETVYFNDIRTTTLISTREFYIHGNFGDIKEDIIITFSDGETTEELEIISADLPGSISASKPQSNLKNGTFTVSVHGERSNSSENTYSFLDPLKVNLNDSNQSGYWEEEITLTGQAFQIDGLVTSIKMFKQGQSPTVDAGLEAVLINISNDEVTFRVPRASVSSFVYINNGLEELTFDFEVKYKVIYPRYSIPTIRAAGIVGSEVYVHLINSNLDLSDHSVRLTRLLDGKTFTPQLHDIKDLGNYLGDYESGISFNLPDEVGLYKLEVTVGGQTFDGGYSVYAYESETMGYITIPQLISYSGNNWLSANGTMFGYSLEVQGMYIELLDTSANKQVVYTAKVTGYSYNDGKIYQVEALTTPPSGTYYMRVRKDLDGVSHYTPLAHDKLIINY